MSEVKHTPGPWRVEIATFGGGYAQGFGIFPSTPTVDPFPGIDQHSITSANLSERGAFTAFYSSEVIEANARLIAAAPDLLAAVKAFVAYDSDDDSDVSAMLAYADALALAKAALSKAEPRP